MITEVPFSQHFTHERERMWVSMIITQLVNHKLKSETVFTGFSPIKLLFKRSFVWRTEWIKISTHYLPNISVFHEFCSNNNRRFGKWRLKCEDIIGFTRHKTLGRYKNVILFQFSNILKLFLFDHCDIFRQCYRNWNDIPHKARNYTTVGSGGFGLSPSSFSRIIFSIAS